MVNEILKNQNYIIGKKLDCKLAIPKEKLINKLNENKNIINNSFSSSNSNNNNIPINLRKMFVGGLHPSLTTENLIKYFSQFGEVEKGIIMTDKITGKSRGFGFIIFSNKETIDKIMSYSNCHFLYGKWVECKRAQPKIKNMKMLDDNQSFPKFNYNNDLFQDLNQNFTIHNSFENHIFFNESLGCKNINNDFYINNKNLLFNQNYIPKEQIKLLNEINGNSTKSDYNSINKKIDNMNNYNSYVNNNINKTPFENSLLFNNNIPQKNQKKNKELIDNQKNRNLNFQGKEYQNYFNNNNFLNSSFYNYFQYKLFDLNDKDMSKLNIYNGNNEKLSLFPKEIDNSFEKKNINNNIKDVILKNNKINNLSSNEIEVSSDLVDKNNKIKLYDNKKEKNKNYPNDIYRPY